MRQCGAGSSAAGVRPEAVCTLARRAARERTPAGAATLLVRVGPGGSRRADYPSLSMPASSLSSVAGNVAVNVLAAGAVVALIWFRDFVLLRLSWAWRWIYSLVTRKRYVLVWIDDDRSHSRKLIKRLGSQSQEGVVARPSSCRALRRPRSLLFYPLSYRRTKAVVLFDTDVSKLADEARVARRVEDRVREYVENGGGLIGSHDLIYRRVRSESLQRIFGCRITNFEGVREKPVRYRINPQYGDHPLRRDLGDTFELDDGEVCSGDWAPDVAAIYTTDDEHEHPLVVAREYAEGRLVWVNSGDKAEWLCGSLARPEEPLVVLLRNALDWVSETR